MSTETMIKPQASGTFFLFVICKIRVQLYNYTIISQKACVHNSY